MTTTENAPAPIIIHTANSSLTLAVKSNGCLVQVAYGKRRTHRDYRPSIIPLRDFDSAECFPTYGNGCCWEPALHVVHADGDTSTSLVYSGHETVEVDDNILITRISLSDTVFPFNVILCFKAFQAEDLIEQWVEVSHDEEKPVTLIKCASSAIGYSAQKYYATQFQGEWAREVKLREEELTPGVKIFDSKFGVRAHLVRMPSFLLGLNQPVEETSGEVLAGSLAWSGNFQFAFDLDADDRLRVTCGINPHGAPYRLPPGETYRTPSMLWSWSNQGKGQVSRNFHRWARRYGIREGERDRPVLLNNWEATYFDFDEAKIVSLFEGAKALGAEIFLLDDGWFGNQHPRNHDRAGLGDWKTNEKKLPKGLSHLAKEAQKRGVNFGIWIEPEMVNPQSDLYEAHPDWVICQPKRELHLWREQLILDLTRPEVQQFIREIIDETLAANPGIEYVKWDCNRCATQPGSTHLAPEDQGRLLTDYQWALYALMGYMVDTCPQVMAMLCASGGGRVDYGAMKYFHSFWPSDNTDPVARVFIQWSYSHIFPANVLCAHVTRSGNRPIKFTLDVALSGVLGVDRDVQKMSSDEREATTAAIRLYKESIRDLITRGELYRLESPYTGPRAVLSYLSVDRQRAVLFVYQVVQGLPTAIRLSGLDADKQYRVSEVNLPEGGKSKLPLNQQLVSGGLLMEEGLIPPVAHAVESAVILLEAE